MSIKLTIGTQVINFPSAGQDPQWAQGIIQFAEAVTTQLQGISSAFDILPSVQVLTIDANTTPLSLNGVVFPSDQVRGFVFSYSIYRTNGVIALAEDGTVNGVYNTLTSTWTLEHEFNGLRQANGTPYHTFNMSGDTLQLSTVGIGGSYDTVNSKISFFAKTCLINEL